MPSTYHIDYETASSVILGGKGGLGGYRYACDESTVILMFAIRKNDGDVFVWDSQDSKSSESKKAKKMFKQASKKGSVCYAWNAPFEHAVSRYQLEKQVGIKPIKIENWRCVAAMGARAGMPRALAAAAKILNKDEGSQKDKIGGSLIGIFSDLNKVVTLKPPIGAKDYTKSERGRKPANRKTFSPIQGWFEVTKEGVSFHDEILWDWLVSAGGEEMTVRKAWDLFKEYNRQDVIVESEVHDKLHHFELKGRILKSFQFNMRMNDKGIPVNREALAGALKIVEAYQNRIGTRFKNITGLSPSQNIKFKAWMQERGYPYDNLQADTVTKAIKDDRNRIKKKAYKALKLLQLVNFAALKKIPTMLNAVCPDGMVRGTMRWHGARTGRATGQVVQPQNMKKAQMETELAYRMLCEGTSLEEIEEFWDSPLEVIASCARHFIHEPGTMFFDSDYTGVEARITPWLAGDKKKMDSILRGECQYLKVAETIYKVPYDKLKRLYKAKDAKVGKWRTTSKPVELGCCFGVGGRALQKDLREKYGVKISLDEAKAIVKTYRENSSETVDAWRAIEDAVKAVIPVDDRIDPADRKKATSPPPEMPRHGYKKPITILNGRITIGTKKTGGIRYLFIELPSGRRLYYPRAKFKCVWRGYSEDDLLEAKVQSIEKWKKMKKAKGSWRKEIRFWGSKDSKPFNWVATWGSRFFENIVQAIGVDLLDYGCLQLEKHGHDIFMIVHDQTIGRKNGLGRKHFKKHFCAREKWSKTFPLDASVDYSKYYLKED